MGDGMGTQPRRCGGGADGGFGDFGGAGVGFAALAERGESSMSITATQARARYGPAERESGMVLWNLPEDLHGTVPTLPRRIYLNRDLRLPLMCALERIAHEKLGNAILTWDGCFNIRLKRQLTGMSLYSWGLAVDLNAAWNRLGRKPTMNPRLVEAFEASGFEWGGRWLNPDGMHFQLERFPPAAPKVLS
jgi:hypothetical protein